MKTRHDDIGEMDGAPDVEGAVASAVKKAIISQVSSNNRIKFIIIWQLFSIHLIEFMNIFGVLLIAACQNQRH